MLVVFVMVAIATIAQPQQYRSTTNLLVVQRYSWNMDAYNASRSTQYLSTILSKVVYSQSFLDQVMAPQYGVKNVFSSNPEKRRKQWEQMVRTRTVDQTGVISIDVYHTEHDQADRISRAIENILATKGDQYHGGGNQVTLKTIDAPYTTDRPVKPSVPLNLIAGLVLGLFLGFSFTALFPTLTLVSPYASMPVFPTIGALAADERGSVQLGITDDFGQPTDQYGTHET